MVAFNRNQWSRSIGIGGRDASVRALGRFSQDVEAAGLVGEERAAKLLYLTLTSRFFDQPVSVILKGRSGAGKSETVKKVLRFFPAEIGRAHV